MNRPFGALPARTVWGVSALLLAAGDALAARFGSVSVRGELSGYTRAASGHCYFTLKDADGATGTLRCAMFRRAAVLLDFQPRDGQQVELRGRMAVYEARGELQLVVESMQQVGAGSLYEQFLRLKARLEAQGLFSTERKRPLPPFPQRVGVITSLGAAALHDVLTALQRRAPQVEVIVYPSLVQGPEAPASLVAALTRAAQRNEVDTLILCRGGGSLEDLWAFNDERVVRAVADSPIPLVCGVGHETDVSLCDFAADLRAPTPTAAAELVSPARMDSLARLAAIAHRLQALVHRRLEGQAQHLDRRAMQLARPAQALARQAQRLQGLEHRRQQALRQVLQQQALAQQQAGARLHRALAQHFGRAEARLQNLAERLPRAPQPGLARAEARLGALAGRLQALDPARVLQRGYAWVTGEDGHAVTSAAALQPGSRIAAVFADGRADALVQTVHAERRPTPDTPV
ncbi:exodeoxyribonuclease VII large subunit [Aquincola sp. J276]|uniref:exodeoxyribonuclease VII large subunit n=1 Tax=Aquincola sp. J276 TaxID=2898432 RepID=UPI0021519B1F|nr:exodeoxyribonuclease VII large subunit [Aquincola sp. J276]MCR5864380.1 exodeoxyribonuclease VII large subunit [Aquincola sp. J276]